MGERPAKPRKSDFDDPMDFMKASAAWAEEWNVWPWDSKRDDDDHYYFEVAE